ncbi:MAG: hypothetical protein CVV41_02120 [Candidatus Riflebacteria bacterium HGW-Riflebacteria-1]|nr:MAG: hypothetical protein CVV41_02120 [Candidatus Riflebacteria bacterium HGW-Riflebacteria-1]
MVKFDKIKTSNYSMQNPDSEILLISIDAEPAGNLSTLRSFGNRFAPLGLLCLAASAPDRIATLVGRDTAQFYDNLAIFGKVRAIIVQFNHPAAPEMSARLINRLRQQFPGAKIGASKQLQAHSELFDFVISGTGKTAVLRILRGETPLGYFDQPAAESFSILDVPTEPLAEGEFEIHPEKWLAGRTLEVFQPWLGLLDQSDCHSSWPGIEWLTKLLNWLKLSGYQALHFRPSGLSTEHLHELRSVMLNLEMPFAVSFNISEQLHFSRVGAPLKQIWLYHPNRENAALTLEKLAQIKAADCLPGLQLKHSDFALPAESSLINAVARIQCSDLHCWPLSDLKLVTARFWRRRFFARLFGLRSAAELIMFMKTSYNILDILLSSERGR